MKAFLMHRDRDFDLERELPRNEEALSQDLELDRLCQAMALGDPLVFEVAKRALLTSLTDPDAILYRQHVLADCLEHPAVVQEVYGIAGEAILAERKVWPVFGRSSPDSILHRSVQVLELFVGFLKRLRALADDNAGKFRSEGLVRFFAMVAKELDDEYFRTVEAHLRELRFRDGVLISARLGKGNKGTGYVLRRPGERRRKGRFARRGRSRYSFQIADRDESGFRALTELRGRGINLVADAIAQSADHILSFFTMVQAELAFYVGCLNLHARLAEQGEPTCFPAPVAPGRRVFSARGLYDVCLAVQLGSRVVGNDVNADGKTLVMVTGANQGGKSTFLRAVGLAQLMLQSGMFVGAESSSAEVRDRVFTHYKREEDATMESGKLDEELSRMSDIADTINRNSLLLCNESFAATNEREGSEIARQVVRALTEAGIKVFFVTHLFDLANSLYARGLDTALFLRAERHPDGRRTFRLVEGEPLPTSYGEDSYRRIFGTAPDSAPPAVADVRP
jgi:hypothetical protein